MASDTANQRVLVFQHVEVEHPGIFRRFLSEHDMDYHAIELDKGESIPDLNGYDALWVMGGPMDVWQQDQYPWLSQEIDTIREAVIARKLPFLGLCLGHQLLAVALDGEVGPAKTPEIGVLDVSLTEGGRKSPFLAKLPATFSCLQWHSAEVVSIPATVEPLMYSNACACQAMSYEEHALSLQFHVEIEDDTVQNWAAIPQYAEALESSLGAGAIAQLEAAVAGEIGQMNAIARQLFDNWRETTA